MEALILFVLYVLSVIFSFKLFVHTVTSLVKADFNGEDVYILGTVSLIPVVNLIFSTMAYGIEKAKKYRKTVWFPKKISRDL
jgi:hypothetical protein